MGFLDRLAVESKEASADFEFPINVREECDLFMVAHFVNERSVLTLVTVAGLQFTREELAAPRSGADPFTNCRLHEDANARAAAAALPVARIGDALMARLEQLQTEDAPVTVAPGGLLNASSLPHIGSPVVPSPYGLVDAPKCLILGFCGASCHCLCGGRRSASAEGRYVL